MSRFLQVTPSSAQDKSLLLEVLTFITSIVRLSGAVPPDVAQWLAQRLYDVSGPLVGLLNHSPPGSAQEEEGDGSAAINR